MARPSDIQASRPRMGARAMIRDFVPTDAESVRTLLSAIPEATQWPSEDFLLASERNMLFRVAEDEGMLCGLVIFRIIADEAEILNLAIDRGRRRQGIASRLIYDVIAAAKVAGAERIFLEVRDSNRAARSFYAQMEFIEVGRRRQYYQQPTEDALVLARTIHKDSNGINEN